LDWLLLHTIARRTFGRNIRFIAKEKVARHSWFRPLVRATDSIIIEGGKASQAILLAARAITQSPAGADPVIGIFPEGKRSRDGRPLPPHPGAAWLARKTEVPLIPVALLGFWEIWPPGRRLPLLKRRRLAIHIFDPIEPTAIKDDQVALNCAMNQIYDIVLRDRAIATP
jgi:1-acyl-sn-glycerol-3-phosphate acyltransferase